MSLARHLYFKSASPRKPRFGTPTFEFSKIWRRSDFQSFGIEQINKLYKYTLLCKSMLPTAPAVLNI